MIKGKSVLFLTVMIILISSAGAINAQEIDENQTDYLELASDLPEIDESDELLSASDNEEVLQASDAFEELSSAYLVLDNDADKENINVGDYITWILEAQNLGPDMAKNVKVHDKLPDGLKYVKHSTTKGDFNPKTGIWDIGNLTVADGLVTLLITTKAISEGEKINEAYITSDTVNTNNETFEEEEIDVFAKETSKKSVSEKHVSAKMHETGNPILLILISLFALFPVIKR